MYCNQPKDYCLCWWPSPIAKRRPADAQNMVWMPAGSHIAPVVTWLGWYFLHRTDLIWKLYVTGTVFGVKVKFVAFPVDHRCVQYQM